MNSYEGLKRKKDVRISVLSNRPTAWAEPKCKKLVQVNAGT